MNRKQKLVNQFLAEPPEARFEDVRLLLEMFGFEKKRSKGSHHIFGNEQGETITIPKTKGQKVKRVYIRRIIELLELAIEEDSEDDPESELDV